MAVSSVVAFAGIGLAACSSFSSGATRPTRVAERFAGLHRVLLNKYYVDEIYDARDRRSRSRIAVRAGLWKAVDVRVIDGAVNGVRRRRAGWRQLLRRMQTGSVRAYAASLFLGVV